MTILSYSDDREGKPAVGRGRRKPAFANAAWLQMLCIIRFWLKDSNGFEKTDVIIEKSINTVFDLFETKPLDSLIDLGKFLWKEKKREQQSF